MAEQQDQYRKNDAVTTTLRVTVTGKVQGVGFRPFILRLAQSCGVTGTARNAGGFVEIFASAAPAAVRDFVEHIRSDAPAGAEIFGITAEEESSAPVFRDFRIIPSGKAKGVVAPMPDIAVCEDCVRELSDPANPRHRHPYISCTACGPRFSIISDISYDRGNTSMRVFPPCVFCEDEYSDTDNRRCHSQTIACNQCGPVLMFTSQDAAGAAHGADPISEAVRAIRAGRIVAIKGIGGYHLAANPYNAVTIDALRKMKGRDAKPFAVMFDTMEELERYAFVSPEEKELLLSPARPIVLLDRKEQGPGRGISPNVFGTASRIGAFMPYSPVHHLLLRELGAVALTSANVSDSPIIYRDEEITGLGVDVLAGDRDILNPQDDSVMQALDGRTYFIRRARGFVPDPIRLPAGVAGRNVFAAGGDLKSVFCLANRDGLAYLGQYVGDLYDIGAAKRYADNLRKFRAILGIEPDIVVCDMHPAYESTSLAAGMKMKTIRVQHHFAHAASVMAEHGLEEKTIAVMLDGTGYGTDGGIWGGEVLICEGDLSGYTRAAHLREAVIIGGDSAVHDARRTAFTMLRSCGFEELAEEAARLSGLGESETHILASAMQNGVNSARTTSAGRLFDAVSSLLGVKGVNTYEAECAMMLEALAWKTKSAASGLRIPVEHIDGKLILDYAPLLKAAAEAGIEGADPAAFAAGFHIALATAVKDICEELRRTAGTGTVALSGGVYQNRFLLRESLRQLGQAGFKVYTNERVPANDGGIALGQAYIGMRSNI